MVAQVRQLASRRGVKVEVTVKVKDGSGFGVQNSPEHEWLGSGSCEPDPLLLLGLIGLIGSITHIKDEEKKRRH